jgi:hypothetical protein
MIVLLPGWTSAFAPTARAHSAQMHAASCPIEYLVRQARMRTTIARTASIEQNVKSYVARSEVQFSTALYCSSRQKLPAMLMAESTKCRDKSYSLPFKLVDAVFFF